MKGAIELRPHPVHARDLEVGAAAHHMQLLVSKEAAAATTKRTGIYLSLDQFMFSKAKLITSERSNWPRNKEVHKKTKVRTYAAKCISLIRFV